MHRSREVPQSPTGSKTPGRPEAPRRGTREIPCPPGTVRAPGGVGKSKEARRGGTDRGSRTDRRSLPTTPGHRGRRGGRGEGGQGSLPREPASAQRLPDTEPERRAPGAAGLPRGTRSPRDGGRGRRTGCSILTLKAFSRGSPRKGGSSSASIGMRTGAPCGSSGKGGRQACGKRGNPGGWKKERRRGAALGRSGRISISPRSSIRGSKLGVGSEPRAT